MAKFDVGQHPGNVRAKFVDDLLKHILTAQSGAKPDPRIEELVRQNVQGFVEDLGKHGMTTQPAAKPDPRIEELVRQAEAIKPGSGNQVRWALRTSPSYANPGLVPLPVMPPAISGPTPPGMPVPPPPPHAIVKSTAGDKVIIIVLSDGKMLHLQHGAVLKDVNSPPKHPGDAKAVDLQNAIDALIKSGQMKEAKKVPDLPMLMVPPTAVKPPVPPTQMLPDVEAIARKLERLNAELNELRRRLDAEKKAQKNKVIRRP